MPPDGREQGVPARRHARARHDARLDGIPQIYADVEDAVRVEKSSYPGAQQLLHVVGGHQRAKTLPAMKEHLVVGMGFVQRHVAMRVDESGHDRLARDVDDGRPLIVRRAHRGD